MDVRRAVTMFIKNEDLRKMELTGANPASMKVKVWRILQKFTKETGIDPEITISIRNTSIILTKDSCDAAFLTKEGNVISFEDLLKEN